MITLGQVLYKLRPNGDWKIVGKEIYSNLEWFGGGEKPSEDEINTEIARFQAEYEATEYQRKRAAEYPDFRDYLDGIVKGDQAQVQAYIDACNAVKAKYPKG